jgi:VanZ family protein
MLDCRSSQWVAFERWRGVVVALSMILLGAVMEGGQQFSPGRTPDVNDAIANSLGVFSRIALRLLAAATLAHHQINRNRV